MHRFFTQFRTQLCPEPLDAHGSICIQRFWTQLCPELGKQICVARLSDVVAISMFTLYFLFWQSMVLEPRTLHQMCVGPTRNVRQFV